VGKSTLINALVNRNLAESSKTPGKTRKLFLFNIPQLNVSLVDSPGYGYAKASHEDRDNWKELMEKYLKLSKTYN